MQKIWVITIIALAFIAIATVCVTVPVTETLTPGWPQWTSNK